MSMAHVWVRYLLSFIQDTLSRILTYQVAWKTEVVPPRVWTGETRRKLNMLSIQSNKDNVSIQSMKPHITVHYTRFSFPKLKFLCCDIAHSLCWHYSFGPSHIFPMGLGCKGNWCKYAYSHAICSNRDESSVLKSSIGYQPSLQVLLFFPLK